MGKNTPDPRKKMLIASTPKKKISVFIPLNENALKTVSKDVLLNKLRQLDEVEDAYKRLESGDKNYKDISATAYGRAMGIKGTGPQISKLKGFRKDLEDELGRRKEANQGTN